MIVLSLYTLINIAKSVAKKCENFLAEPRIEPGTSLTPVWRVTTRQPRQVNVSIEVKLFTCFNVIGNKQSHFCYILTCMDNYIGQFLMFIWVGLTAWICLKRC